MPENRAFYRSIACLAHPASLSAGAILLINALVLQPNYPSWWTGKLGDFAWMVFVPFFLAIVLSLLIPRQVKHQETITGMTALSLTALVWTMIKISPFFNTFLVQMLRGLTHSAIKINLDATDLLALPALGIAWLIWKSTPIPARPISSFKLAGVIFLMFIVIADAAPPIDNGITCLAQTEDGILALRKNTFQQKSTWRAFISQDSGATWEAAGMLSSSTSSTLTPEEKKLNDMAGKCRLYTASWEYTDPNEPSIRYLFMSRKAIYRSEDQGNNYHKELDTPEDDLYDALVDQQSGNLLVAAGRAGIAIRKAQAEWFYIKIEDIAK